MTLWDRGAQPERTALAWSRTTLALIVAGLLCVRFAPSMPAAAASAAVVCGGAALQLRRARIALRLRHHRLAEGTSVADPVSVLLTTALTITLAVAGPLLALA
ncbi:DUF202 domain-containing protein [Spirillospora albida]|uniref:DUF202 domain-containing protein n=1 Tax=Spirillospora albida TaxID=58123 RepID=UPI0004BEFEFF|nr:DUF202 domain-containing protein [Spirillospora albida]